MNTGIKLLGAFTLSASLAGCAARPNIPGNQGSPILNRLKVKGNTTASQTEVPSPITPATPQPVVKCADVEIIEVDCKPIGKLVPLDPFKLG